MSIQKSYKGRYKTNKNLTKEDIKTQKFYKRRYKTNKNLIKECMKPTKILQRIYKTNKNLIKDDIKPTKTLQRNRRERDQWGDPDLDGRIILRWIFRKWEGVVGTGWSWLRIGTGGEHL